MNERPDYGPTGCCRELALVMLTVLVGISWGVVFGVVQLVRWIA